jgi:hypothetical protein
MPIDTTRVMPRVARLARLMTASRHIPEFDARRFRVFAHLPLSIQ